MDRRILPGSVAALLSLGAAPPPDAAYVEGRAIIAGLSAIVTPAGVDETFTATLGGVPQVVNVRGADRTNPILVFVHGGPGAVEMPIAWAFQRPWEDWFTVVQYDQRGAGRSYRLTDPAAVAPTLTIDRYRDDTIELIELLRRRYGKRRVILLGHSWGSVVGLSVAAKRPDLLHAYVGMGQYIDPQAGERESYAWTLARAKADGNATAIRELEALRPYPGNFAIEKIDGERKWAVHYGGLFHNRRNGDFYFRAARLSPLYSAADRQAWDDGSALSVKRVEPQLAATDFTGLTRMAVPVFMLEGRHDRLTPSAITARWIERLRAPTKGMVWFENSAHMMMIEEPGRTLDALVHTVRPYARDGEATPRPDTAPSRPRR